PDLSRGALHLGPERRQARGGDGRHLEEVAARGIGRDRRRHRSMAPGVTTAVHETPARKRERFHADLRWKRAMRLLERRVDPRVDQIRTATGERAADRGTDLDGFLHALTRHAERAGET